MVKVAYVMTWEILRNKGDFLGLTKPSSLSIQMLNGAYLSPNIGLLIDV
jgi:hypothetical protein